MPGTQWMIFDAVSGVLKAGLYWPGSRDLDECRMMIGPPPGTFFPPIGAGDTIAEVVGDAADEPALDAFVAEGHLHTVADLVALYPDAIVNEVPVLTPATAAAGWDRRFAPGLRAVADFSLVTNVHGRPEPDWETRNVLCHF